MVGIPQVTLSEDLGEDRVLSGEVTKERDLGGTVKVEQTYETPQQLTYKRIFSQEDPVQV